MLVSVGSSAVARSVTVVTSTGTKIVVKDEWGDQESADEATGIERRAADILRLKAWQEGRSGWVSMTLRGSITDPDVVKWESAVTFSHRNPYEHPIVRLEIGRAKSRVRVFLPDGAQILCRRTPSLITNEGRTLTTRIPRGCGWERVHRFGGYVLVKRTRFDDVAGDSTRSRCRLVWQ
jgi:hypothetical protein